MIVIDCIQDSEEWYKLKCGVPSASNASKILTNDGKPSKQQEGYLYELVAERITGKQEETYKNINMLIGNEREAESREAFEFMHKVKTQQVGVIYKDERKLFLCSPDSIIKKIKTGLELKNPLPKTQVKYLLDGGLPNEYFGQCQMSLYITGFKVWWFMSYVPVIKPLIIEVKRDETYIRALAIELELFCERLNEITNKLK